VEGERKTLKVRREERVGAVTTSKGEKEGMQYLFKERLTQTLTVSMERKGTYEAEAIDQGGPGAKFQCSEKK